VIASTPKEQRATAFAVVFVPHGFRSFRQEVFDHYGPAALNFQHPIFIATPSPHPTPERAFAMNAIAKFVLPRLKERSTYVGLVGLLTAFGIAIDPTYVDVALAVGAAVAGVIGIVWKDTTSA